MSDIRVLVVDDDPLSRTALADLLNRQGYDAVEARNGEQALERFVTGEYLAVITDLRMPRMDGLELLGRLRERDPAVPVVLVTAYGSVQTAVEAMKEGASDYVTKPFSSEEILATLTRLADLQRLQRENRDLRTQIQSRYGFANIVGRSPGMRAVFEMIQTVARSRSTVLIQGESGTGKELVARALHYQSDRSSGPFVAVSCAALAENLLESELFGHEKGAFTGATGAKPGRVELAGGGTLFLDDIDDIPLNAQVKLLRVLQERVVERVGTVKSRKVDVRVVAATKIDLRQAAAEGAFRDDLFYRLSVIPITLPPLRERTEDIPLLVNHFLVRFAERDGRDPLKLSPDCLQVLEGYGWPGNVRELENVVERLAAVCPGPRCGLEVLPPEVVSGGAERLVAPIEIPPDGLDLTGELDRFESRILRWAIERTGGNKSKMARMLQISRSTLADHMRRLGLD